MRKVLNLHQACEMREHARALNKIVVFTNGCFDVLHEGHVEYLARSKAMGALLFVALNTDESVRNLKGSGRPHLPFRMRAEILCALSFVDGVIPLDDSTPAALIEVLRPDVLTKGPDWPIERIVGRQAVLEAGGHALSISSSFPDSSSTALIKSRKLKTLSSSVGSALAKIDGQLFESARDALRVQDEMVAEHDDGE